MLRVLVSVIGDPRNYKPARYYYGGGQSTSKFSSSVLLDVLKPDKSVLIGQYTLAKGGGGFEDLQRASLDLIRKEVNEASEFTDVVIAPGVIHTKDKEDGREYVYRGDIFNFYAYVLHRLARIFEGLSGDVEVTLDLTHGINYMGHLTLTALNLVLDIYSMRNKVRLRVVNSDPYPQGLGDQVLPDLGINVVLERDVQPTFVYPAHYPVVEGSTPYVLAGPSLEYPLRPYPGSGGDLSGVFGGMRDCLLNQDFFIRAVASAALLAAYTFADEFSKCVDSAVNHFARNIDIDDKPESFIVTPKYSFTRTFESLVIAEFLRSVAGINRSRRVRIDELHEKAGIYMKNFILHRLIMTQISDLRSGKVRRAEATTDDQRRRARNFLAHAGFLDGTYEVDQRTMEVWYRDESLEEIKGILEPKYRGGGPGPRAVGRGGHRRG